jgi:hypothetical protein
VIAIPIYCEVSDCKNFGKVVNLVSVISEDELDCFYENFADAEDSDICPLCGILGIAEEPYFA